MAENGTQNESANSAQKDAAALLLAAGRSVRDTAAELGIGERTIHRWREDPAFRKREAALRGELLAAGFGKLADTAGAAADVLKKLLDSESENIKLAAARAVLQLGADLRKTIELEAEMKELNRRLDEIETARRKKGKPL